MTHEGFHHIVLVDGDDDRLIMTASPFAEGEVMCRTTSRNGDRVGAIVNLTTENVEALLNFLYQITSDHLAANSPDDLYKGLYGAEKGNTP